MKTLAIIQARLGSSRLPGKTLLPIFQDKGALELMLLRLRCAKRIDCLAVATTVAPEDNALVELCERLGVPCFRGPVDDVLDRFDRAARSLGTPRCWCVSPATARCMIRMSWTWS